MTNVNKLWLAGRLTRDPELTYSQGGMAIAKIGCATNHRRKKGDDWIDEAVFVEVKMFGKRAEAFVQFHYKGSNFCFPDSRLAFDEWESKDSGERRTKLYVIAESWEFIGGKAQPADPVPTGEEPF